MNRRKSTFTHLARFDQTLSLLILCRSLVFVYRTMGDVDDSNAGFATLQGKENCVYFLVWNIQVGGGIG